MDWSSLVPTLVGGGISLVTSLAIFGFASRKERISRADERRTESASSAYEGIAKIAALFNSLYSVEITLNEIFEEAAADEHANLPPGVKVTPIRGLPESLPELGAKEIAFLLRSQQNELYHNVLQFELKARSVVSSLKTFNEMRVQYQEQVSAQILAGADAVFSESGQQAKLEMEGPIGAMFSARIGVLNSLIGQILEELDLAIPLGKQVLSEYQTAAYTAFGDEFLVKSVGFP